MSRRTSEQLGKTSATHSFMNVLNLTAVKGPSEGLTWEKHSRCKISPNWCGKLFFTPEILVLENPIVEIVTTKQETQEDSGLVCGSAFLFYFFVFIFFYQESH